MLPLLVACAAPSIDVTPGTDGLVMPEEIMVTPFTPEPGYPPKLGTASLDSAGTVQIFTTFDFSVGAFDASAWFDSRDGVQRFAMTAYPEENPDAEVGLLRVTADLPGGRVAGSEGAPVLVEIWWEDRGNGRKLTSAGHPASLVIDRFTPDSESTSGYGQATGRFEATLCPGMGDPAKVTSGADCQEVRGSFDTRVQYSP
jgi:hypothetical protein